MLNRTILLSSLLLAACAGDTQIQAPMPTLGFSGASYAGYDETLIDTSLLPGPGGLLSWASDWSGTCQHDNLFDGPTTESCDSPTYDLTVTCSGIACTTNPSDAVEEKGTKLTGPAFTTVDVESTGTLVTTASITHGATTLSGTQTVDVVVPDSLVLECAYEPSGAYPSVACPSSPSAYFQGAVFLFYVYGKKDGQLVDIGADIGLDGFTVLPGTSTPGQHDTAYTTVPGAGTYTVYATFRDLVASYSVTLQ